MTDNARSATQTLERLKRVAEIVGVVGGMGAAATGVAFGIGYLATKHHDEMLGVPTTTTDYTTYVRTGAIFLTQSLHDLVEVIAKSVPPWWVLALVALVTCVGIWLLSRFGQRVITFTSQAVIQRWLLNVAFLAVFLGAIAYLPTYFAPLDEGNKSLLFDQRPVQGEAKAVNDYLRAEEGEQQLHYLYGTQATLVLGLVLAVALLRRWRARIHAQPPSAPLSLLDRTIPSASYVIVAILVLTIPAIYGVIAMSTSLPCVQLYKGGKGSQPTELGDPGYLVSDLSSEKAKVAILRWDLGKNSYFVDFHSRDSLLQMEVRYCPERNPIHRVLGGKRGRG